MAVRFVDVAAVRAKLAARLDDVTGALQATHTAPPGRTGVIQSQLDSVKATIQGTSGASPNRTAVIASHLGDVTASLAGTFTGSGGSGTIYLSDDFQDRSVGGITINTPWSSKGYTDSEGPPAITDRSGYGSWLLSDSNLPAAKTRFYEAKEGGVEDQKRIVWEGFGSNHPTTLYVSWWEARGGASASANHAGEKFLRMGNRIANGNRGLDLILCYGQGGLFEFISNSPNGFDVGDIGLTVFPWTGNLMHWEFLMQLSTGTSANGAIQLWANGTSIASQGGLRMFKDSTSAPLYISLVELGGWNSGNDGWQQWPIQRVIPQWKIASTRQGVWPIQTT